MKKLLTVLLTVLMACSILTVNVFAEDEEVIPEVEEITEVVEEKVEETEEITEEVIEEVKEEIIEEVVEKTEEEILETVDQEGGDLLLGAPAPTLTKKKDTYTAKYAIMLTTGEVWIIGRVAKGCEILRDTKHGNKVVYVEDEVELHGITNTLYLASDSVDAAKAAEATIKEITGKDYEFMWFGSKYDKVLGTVQVIDFDYRSTIADDDIDVYAVYKPKKAAPAPKIELNFDGVKGAEKLVANGEAQKLLTGYPEIKSPATADDCTILFRVDGGEWKEWKKDTQEPKAIDEGVHTVEVMALAKEDKFANSEIKKYEVEISPKPATYLAEYPVIIADKEFFNPVTGRQIATNAKELRDEKGNKVVIKSEVALHGLTKTIYYLSESLDDVKAAEIKDADGNQYDFVWFGRDLVSGTNSVSSVISNERSIVFDQFYDVFAVYVKHVEEPKPLKLDLGDIKAVEDLVFNGEDQKLLEEGYPTVTDNEGKSVDSDKYVIQYSLDEGVTWTTWTQTPDNSPVGNKAGDYNIWIKVAPVGDDTGFTESEITKLTNKIAKFEIDTNPETGNATVDNIGPSEDGTEVEFDIFVDLDGDGDFETELDPEDYRTDGGEKPKKFGMNVVTVYPANDGNYDFDPIQIEYFVDGVLDQYVEYVDGQDTYRFDVTKNDSTNIAKQPFRYYTAKTANGYTVTVIEKVSGNFAAVTRTDNPSVKNETGGWLDKVVTNGTNNEEQTYYFVIGDTPSMIRFMFEEETLPLMKTLLDGKYATSAKLVVLSKEDHIEETNDDKDSDYIYVDTGKDVDIDPEDTIKFVVEKTEKQNAVEENEKQGNVGTVDVYLLLFEDGKDYGVKIAPKNPVSITINALDLFYGELPAAKAGHKIVYTVYHHINTGEVKALSTTMHNNGDVSFVTDGFSNFTLAYKYVETPHYVPVKTGVE